MPPWRKRPAQLIHILGSGPMDTAGPSTRRPIGLPSLAGRCPAPESASILIKANALDVEEGDIHRPARSPDLGEIDPHFGQYSGV